MGLIKKYLSWLQKDNPVGEIERYPQLDENNETTLKGVFIAGDLTGIPLLKLASESGKELVDRFLADKEFQKLRDSKTNEEIYDVVIVGAGPAGLAASIELTKNNIKHVVLESSQKFTTIINFPKGKPIFAEPSDYEQKSEIKIDDGTKESLLQDLNEQIKNYDLPVTEDIMVEKIERKGEHLLVHTKEKDFKALRVILAIGKSGNARTLDVPGEDKPKVFNRLFDPADAEGKDLLVVGGGDSALETAISTAEYAKTVTLSFRREHFSRPKEGNEEKLKRLVNDGKIKLMMETNVKEIKDDSVIIVDKDGNEDEIKNDMVFTMIGRELPIQFFKRCGIKLEGEMTTTSKLQFALLLLVAGVIYFGKSSTDFYSHFVDSKLDSFGSVVSGFFSVAFWTKLATLPYDLIAALSSDQIRIWNVTKYINSIAAYISFVGAVILGVYLLVKFIRDNSQTFSFNWKTFKYAYFIVVAVFFIVVFFGGKYYGYKLLGESQSFWYTGFYSLTILIFGLRRIKVKPTGYIKRQTWALILIQALPLFILPEFVFPFLGKIGALGGQSGFVFTQIFPGESYWRSYGFILAWPLNFSNLYNGNITTFWLVFSIIQTFVIIPVIVLKWGKGAYCGWICSCGALAETLGDEYRTLAPHGPKAKKWENFGQFALAFAFIITTLKLISILYNIEIPIINEKVSYTADFFHKFYYIGIDVIFAGLLGAGVYFFLSGRFWCRFGCPLAALMHIYARFSKYRIFADKKKCISCNICTKVCHMGIDVMNYANKGIPMNDVECVRCSACVVNCPTEVLSFGTLPKKDLNNEYYKKNEIRFVAKKNWKSGL